MIPDLRCWCTDLLQFKTRSVRTTTTAVPFLITDASLSGFGATLFHSNEAKVQYLAGAWPQKFNTDAPGIINELETLAVLYAANHFKLVSFHLIVDNTTALHAVRKGRSTNYHINKVLQALGGFNILSTQYVHTSQMISDSLSRMFPQLRREDRNGMGQAEAAIFESRQAGM